jgi:hypothetical protein
VMRVFGGDWSTVSVRSRSRYEKRVEVDGEERVEYKGWLGEMIRRMTESKAGLG